MSDTSPAERARLDQLFNLARQLDDAARERPNLQALVWFHPSNRAELGGGCCLDAIPAEFTLGHEGQRVDIEDWHHTERDRDGRYERWRVILSTTEGTVRNDNTATAFTTYNDLAEQVLAHVPSDDARPPHRFGRLLTHLAELPSVVAWGRHHDFPGSWVRRDGVGSSIIQRGAGEGRPTLEGVRALSAAVRGGFRPVAWCAHLPRPFRTAAELVRVMTVSTSKRERSNTGGRPRLPPAVERLRMALLAFHKDGQPHETTAELALKDAAFRERVEEANRELPANKRLSTEDIDGAFVKKVQVWKRERDNREAEKAKKKQTGRRG